MFAVADHFLQHGSIDVCKHTMSISPAKLVSDGPESLMSQQSPSEHGSDGALPTTSGSNTSGDIVELSDELEKAGGDVKVNTEMIMEEMVKPEGEHDNKLSTVTTDIEILADEQLSGAGDGSNHLNVHDVASSYSGSAVEDSHDEPKMKSYDTVVDQDESEEKDVEDVHNEPTVESSGVVDDQDQSEEKDVERVHNEPTVESSGVVVDQDQSEEKDVEDVHNEPTVESSGVVVDQDQSEKKDMEDVHNEPTVESSGVVNNQDESEEKEIEKIDHNEDMSSQQRIDDEHCDAAKQNTHCNAAAELSSDGDEFEHVTNDQRLDAANIVAEQPVIAEPSVDIDTSVEETAVTVLVSDIPRGLDETVEMYLESKKKGGGKTLSYKYNKRSGSALVVFADNMGNFIICLLLYNKCKKLNSLKQCVRMTIVKSHN